MPVNPLPYFGYDLLPPIGGSKGPCNPELVARIPWWYFFFKEKEKVFSRTVNTYLVKVKSQMHKLLRDLHLKATVVETDCH